MAPVIDGLLTGYEIFRTVYAAQASEQDYQGSPISREADVLLGLAFTGLFLGSTIYGGITTSRCKRLKAGPGPDEALTGVSDEPWSEAPATPSEPAAPPEPAAAPSQAAP